MPHQGARQLVSRLKTLKNLNVRKLDALAAKELEAKNAAEQTAKKKSQTGAELLQAMLDRYKPEDFISCYIPGKPEPVKGKTDIYRVNVELNFNDEL